MSTAHLQHIFIQPKIIFKIGEIGAKSNRGEMKQSKYLAEVSKLGLVILIVVVQVNDP